MSKTSVHHAPTAFAPGKPEIANKEFLFKQKIVYDLLWRVHQPYLKADLYSVGKDFNFERNMGSYKNQECVAEFLRFYEKGMLPHGETFSVFYPAPLEQAIALFKVFYYSKDFDTLYKTAAWARIHLNEGMFIYAFSVAVFHHPETHNIRVPAFHEMFPNLFFDDEVIRKAYDAKTSMDVTKTTHHQEIIIPANYSKFYQKYRYGDEYTLSYYTEDVAVNEIYYFAHLAHPFWMSAKEFPKMIKSRGDRFFFSHKLQYVRYYMERLSNGMGEVEDFDWNLPIPFGYYPNTSYRNGLSLPHREAYAHFPSFNYKWIQDLKTWEHGFLRAIDTGYIIDVEGKFVPIRTQEGLKTLGNIIEGNANSVNPDVYGYYDKLARTVLGFSPEPFNKYKVFPSTMQFFGIDQRDPIFWSLMKKYSDFYERFVSKLPKYNFEELSFPEVRFDSVEVDDITTFFTPADYLISNAVKAHSTMDKTVIKARQYRLDHKPYNYTITMSCKKAMKYNIRVFVGPKYNNKYQIIDLTENWKNFMVLDEWVVDLKVGTNRFERHCKPTLNAVPDEVDGDSFYKKILSAFDGKESYEIPRQPFGFPERMVIPKGRKEGLDLQFFFFAVPFADNKVFHSESPILGHREFMDLPLGFPLDRPVFNNFTDLPNAFFQDFKVYHKDDETEFNVTI